MVCFETLYSENDIIINYLLAKAKISVKVFS